MTNHEKRPPHGHDDDVLAALHRELARQDRAVAALHAEASSIDDDLTLHIGDEHDARMGALVGKMNVRSAPAVMPRGVRM